MKLSDFRVWQYFFALKVSSQATFVSGWGAESGAVFPCGESDGGMTGASMVFIFLDSLILIRIYYFLVNIWENDMLCVRGL